jgi:hypothetical protein
MSVHIIQWGLALTTHSHLAPRLKTGYNYTYNFLLAFYMVKSLTSLSVQCVSGAEILSNLAVRTLLFRSYHFHIQYLNSSQADAMHKNTGRLFQYGTHAVG